jgi:tripartite-type tricarboxylate transporter receptor subunit TctC
MSCRITPTAWIARGAVAGLAASLALASAALAAAPEAFPRKPIRLVVTFPPGGPTDIIARTLAVRLQADWGQPVVVDNRPGAGGNLGTDLVAKATPDGHTLVLGSLGPLAISPHVYSKLPYDADRELAPVALAATSWFFMVVNPTVRATTLKELIAFARDNPGQLAFASSGNGSPSHLAGVLLQNATGSKLVHVPFKGPAPGVAGLLAGEVQLAIETPPLLVPQVKAGKLRALAAARPDRSPLLPDVPTTAEAGLPSFLVGSWYGFLVPAGTPRTAIDKLHAKLTTLIALPEIQERFRSVGADPQTSTPAEFGRFIRSERARWEGPARASGARID